jgi:hypothetical protein
MSRWMPHVDLTRLLEALGNEIVATTQQEVSQACVEEGSSMRSVAREVRELIGAVSGDCGEPDTGLPLAEAMRRSELFHRQH